MGCESENRLEVDSMDFHVKVNLCEARVQRKLKPWAWAASGLGCPWMPEFICLSCCNQGPHTGQLKQQTLLLIILEAGRSQDWAQADAASGEGSHPG